MPSSELQAIRASNVESQGTLLEIVKMQKSHGNAPIVDESSRTKMQLRHIGVHPVGRQRVTAAGALDTTRRTVTLGATSRAMSWTIKYQELIVTIPLNGIHNCICSHL